MCYVSCQAQQKSPFLGFNLTSNSWWNPRLWPRWQPLLVKSQAPTAPPPIKYASSFREDKRLSTENKIVSQYCHKMKTLVGGVSISLPPTLYHDRGLNLRVRQRVKFHEHEWHPDCEQNVYSCSRVTSWLCMVTLFSVIFRAIAIITLWKFKSNFISKLFACFFVGPQLEIIAAYKQNFSNRPGVGARGGN